ncbi:MAG TPA: TetR/AcrR family transcriptional regulator [Myxococcaceae bacterium]|nr:TetR/AcrR family transcriptional regulator [Myxococcaceae bacterium]
MSRTKGSRNADYGATRARLLARVRQRLVEEGGATASFRELAEAAGVSVPTLRHYFATREELLIEALAAMNRDGLPYLHAVAAGELGPLETSLRWLVRALAEGWRRGVGRIHAFGLTAGMDHAELGPAYLDEILEPTLQAAEARLARHVARGDLPRCDLRLAALELLGPVVLALLHQGPLGGTRCRPLDVDALVEEHLHRFLRAYAADRGPGPGLETPPATPRIGGPIGRPRRPPRRRRRLARSRS